MHHILVRSDLKFDKQIEYILDASSCGILLCYWHKINVNILCANFLKFVAEICQDEIPDLIYSIQSSCISN